jgi:hypothetical protein
MLSYVRAVYVEEWRVGRYVAGTRAVAIASAAMGILTVLVMAFLAAWDRVSWWGAVLSAPGGIGLAMPLLIAGAKVTTTVEPDRLLLTVHAAGLRVWRRQLPLRQVRACDIGRRGQTLADGWTVPNRTSLVQRRGSATLVMVTGHPVVVLRTGRFDGRLVIGSRTPDALAAAIRAGMVSPAAGSG